MPTINKKRPTRLRPDGRPQRSTAPLVQPEPKSQSKEEIKPAIEATYIKRKGTDNGKQTTLGA